MSGQEITTCTILLFNLKSQLYLHNHDLAFLAAVSNCGVGHYISPYSTVFPFCMLMSLSTQCYEVWSH